MVDLVFYSLRLSSRLRFGLLMLFMVAEAEGEVEVVLIVVPKADILW